ncbi:hypothetical protein AcV5_001994 [Taiwanofungus camphoratus]|nr:hypothetical protein AcV5_001994 [Antrodia cinnamomea]
MPLYLCVDCGGSKTAAVIADASGEPIARALGGPSNFAYLGLKAFLAVVQETVERALKACPAQALPTDTELTLPPAKPLFAAAWLGVSGCDSPGAVVRLTPPLAVLLGVTPRVANDTHLLAAPMALYDDVSGAIGCVAGTGGIVTSFREAGEGEGAGDDGVGLEALGRVGGWGWILGDEGGGFHVGREAVRALLTEADRASVKPGPPLSAAESDGTKGLKNRILQRFGVDDVFELLTIVHLPDPAPTGTDTPGATPEKDEEPTAHPPYTSLPREKRLSSLSPLVFAAALEDNDPLALRVLAATSGALVDQICVLLRAGRGPAAEEGAAAAPRTIGASESILCLGGSLAGVGAYRALILDGLARQGHVFRRVQVVDDAAVVGARALAVAARGRA